MRHVVKALILAGSVAGLVTSIPLIAEHTHIHRHDGGHSLTIGSHYDDDDGTPVTECSQLNVRFDDDRGARAEEELPAANLRSLKVRGSHHGGVQIVGWDRPTYSVKACKAAALASDLAQIRATFTGDELRTEGPDGDERWVVVYLIRSPRNAVLDLQALNGEISLRDVQGTVIARAENGPISLKNSAGTIDAQTHNGPISLAGGSGNMKLVAQNGPISVRLSGTSWEGGKLDAQTENGPLSLKLLRNYRSGVVVESDGHGPVSCRAQACREQIRDSRSSSNDGDDDDADDDHDQPRRFELGSGAQVVHLSTNNGPLSVKDNG
ncbi:MAG: hypothetical protein JWO56_1600 [Acidobacteria bacterium]|nr:hypothetical protein [Acidobacteriota bacterium]